MSKGKLIILNGGSSNGKSTTSKLIQDSMSEHFMYMGIDTFWCAMPPKQVNLHTTEPNYMTYRSFEENGKPYFQIIPGEELDRAMYGSYLAIKAFLDFGMNVISDQIFEKPEWFHQCLQTLHEEDVFFVGMHVSDEEASRREDQRRTLKRTIVEEVVGMWPDGWHRNSAKITHQNKIYDFEIDNTAISPEETARKIIAAFHQRSDPSAFKRMYQDIQAPEIKDEFNMTNVARNVE